MKRLDNLEIKNELYDIVHRYTNIGEVLIVAALFSKKCKFTKSCDEICTIEFKTSNAFCCKLFIEFFQNKYNYKVLLNKHYDKYICIVKDNETIDHFTKDYEWSFKSGCDGFLKKYFKVNNKNLISFFQILFLLCGYCYDLNWDYKSYFRLNNNADAEDLQDILQMYAVPSKIIRNNNSYLCVISSFNNLLSFLDLLELENSKENLLETKEKKMLCEKINRQTNMEIANRKRILDSSSKQLEAIKKVCDFYGLESLDSNMREYMKLRVSNVECSVPYLSRISPSGMSVNQIKYCIKKLYKMENNITK